MNELMHNKRRTLIRNIEALDLYNLGRESFNVFHDNVNVHVTTFKVKAPYTYSYYNKFNVVSTGAEWTIVLADGVTFKASEFNDAFNAQMNSFLDSHRDVVTSVAEMNLNSMLTYWCPARPSWGVDKDED